MITVVRGALTVLVFVALHAAERRWPLRRLVYPGLRRVAVNLAVGAIAFAAVATIYGMVVIGAVGWAERNHVGLLRWVGMPPSFAAVLAVVLLDYTLWHWHWLNHRVALLWRFHGAHHADLDLDSSTALRFHPGELLLSVPYRAIQVIVLGVAAGPLVLWETLVLMFILFHHSNVRLPLRVEAAIGLFVITPRIHGIHHSRRPEELHRNFGTLASLWDRLHGLRVANIDQASIEIGLPAQANDLLGLRASLELPFHQEAPRK